MKKLYWEGVSHKERTTGISEIEQVVNKHGFLLDFKMFSDISISMIIELPERKVDQLYTDLETYMAMDPFEKIGSENTRDCTVLFNVVFAKGSGDLKIEVPSVPG